MATYFAEVLFFRSFYVCFPSGRYICARLLSIEAMIAKFHVSPVIFVASNCDKNIFCLGYSIFI